MKASLHKLIGTTALGLALFAQGVPAWAGLQFRPEVSVSSTSARGSMAGARYSADGTQYIGCNFYSPVVSCGATDKTGTSLSCRAVGLHWGTAIKSITDFSHILFTVAADGTTCSSLVVDNFSQHLK
jgi:hypothetical protein